MAAKVVGCNPIIAVDHVPMQDRAVLFVDVCRPAAVKTSYSQQIQSGTSVSSPEETLVWACLLVMKHLTAGWGKTPLVPDVPRLLDQPSEKAASKRMGGSHGKVHTP